MSVYIIPLAGEFDPIEIAAERLNDHIVNETFLVYDLFQRRVACGVFMSAIALTVATFASK